jgi:hypothetical protein
LEKKGKGEENFAPIHAKIDCIVLEISRRTNTREETWRFQN